MATCEGETVLNNCFLHADFQKSLVNATPLNFKRDLEQYSNIFFDSFKATGLIHPQASLKDYTNFNYNVMTTEPLSFDDDVVEQSQESTASFS